MNYQPLHHKYRPQTFADLVGQEAIATTLIHALQQQRIAPAYLFTGARGTGKTSSARILAKSLNCLKSEVPVEKPCGVCEVCRAIANGSALDIIEIDAASNTGVDNIRELIERAQFAPVQCRYKVYVIDECHMLSTAAFNALLKTLEEPPAHVVFVLATTDPQRVLPTIISRCQRFDFRRIPLDPMVSHLMTIAQHEKISITDDALTLVAQISQGGLRDAESLLDQLSLLEGEVTVEKVWDLVGSVPERDLMSLLEAIGQDNPETLLDSTRRLMDRGREPLIVLQNLGSFYRDLLIAKTAPTRGDLVAMTPSTWNQLCEFARSLDTATILAGQQHLRNCEVQIKNTTQPRLWLEVTLLGLLPSAIATSGGDRLDSSHQATVANGQQLVRAGTATSAKQSATTSPSPPRQPVTSVSTPTAPVPPPTANVEKPAEHHLTDPEPDEAVDRETDVVANSPGAPEMDTALGLGGIWQEALKQVQPFSTQTLLRQQACLLGLTDQEARIGIINQWLKTAKTKISNLEAAFEQSLQRPIKVSLEIATPAEIKAARELLGSAGSTQGANSGRPGVNTLRDESNPSATAPSPATPSQNRAPAKKPPHHQPQPQSDPVPPPTPSSAATPGSSWEEDEATRAAKQLAEFFGGKVVDLSDGETIAEPVEPVVIPSEALPEKPIAATWQGIDSDIEDEADDEMESDNEDLPF
ncbi:DNA polymerase III subunit gamma/tau [Kovacikia minuta CCNUW1]|uniref:DNA polymerase III subunit gamma/tau n=1 Tax=Kovacikia minuta TaxID=2931930 RepID=UPI001CCFF470|nr:DNA polymerase III subunit gamma/tau [Kovacikia minuta]UBF25158.1 DNA polymerase III subunit gamma/tau [Kovacikia minuta CCNUW1]